MRELLSVSEVLWVAPWAQTVTHPRNQQPQRVEHQRPEEAAIGAFQQANTNAHRAARKGRRRRAVPIVVRRV